MDRFQEMRTFAAVVEAGSFVKAAGALGLSKAAVSRIVSDLEARLGVRLLHRTTRRLALTEEGAVFHGRCRELLAEVEEAEAEVTSRAGEARGLVKVSAPVSFGIHHLAPLWGAFREAHPQVSLDITLADRVVDLVEEGFDLAIRIAKLEGATLVSRRLATTRMVLCASPGYVARHGTPRHPADLAGHAVIAYRYWSTGDEWHFTGPKGGTAVLTRPFMHTNSGDTCRVMALAHHGVILQPDFMVGGDLATGALVELMPEYRSLELGIHAVYPTRRHLPPKVRLLVDFLVRHFARGPWY